LVYLQSQNILIQKERSQVGGTNLTIDSDAAEGLIGGVLTAGVGLIGMKMVADMTTNMFGGEIRCPKGKIFCNTCKKCMKKHTHEIKY